MKLDRRTTALGIALIRVAYGSLMAVAPRFMLRVQLGDRPSGPIVWLARAFGVRDALLGAGVLLAGDEQARRGWVAAGVAADACDVASAVAGRRWLGGRNAAVVAVTAAGATAAGAYALSGD